MIIKLILIQSDSVNKLNEIYLKIRSFDKLKFHDYIIVWNKNYKCNLFF